MSLARSNLAELAVIVWRAATARCEHRILQIICSACRSDLPYIFRITLPAKNLSPFYPIRPEKYVDKPRFIWYIIQAIFCGYGPLVKRLRQRPLTPLTWVRFPHGSPKNTPAYAGVFFRVSRARNRTGRCAAAHKKQSSGLFFSPREIPACVTRNTPAYAGVFFRVSRVRNRTGQRAAAHKKQSSGLFFSPRALYFSRTVAME